MKKIAIIQGVNLNLLGKREKKYYGNFSLEELHKELKEKYQSKANLEFFQSNHEGEIVEYIQSLPQKNIHGIVINPGAFTHTSVAIRDALLYAKIPFIEVHISNIYQREPFRHISYIRDVAKGSIVGLGKAGYFLAIEYFLHYLDE